jgi:CRP-like cAMP-binding protein
LAAAGGLRVARGLLSRRLGHPNSPQKAFSPRSNRRAAEPSVGGEGFQRLKIRLTSHSLPEATVNELIDHHTPLSYPKGSMIFLQGAPTDILYWVSGGLVDIIRPDPEGGLILTIRLAHFDAYVWVRQVKLGKGG